MAPLLDENDRTSTRVRIFGQMPPAVRGGNKTVGRAYDKLWVDVLDRAADEGLPRPGVDRRLARWALIGVLNAALEGFDPGSMDPRPSRRHPRQQRRAALGQLPQACALHHALRSAGHLVAVPAQHQRLHGRQPGRAGRTAKHSAKTVYATSIARIPRLSVIIGCSGDWGSSGPWVSG